MVKENNFTEAKNIVFYDMKNNRKINAIKKRIGTSIVAVVLASSTLMSTAGASFKVQRDVMTSLAVVPAITSLVIKESQLLGPSNPRLDQAIKDNPNLTTYEKGIMAQLAPFINDNPYVDEHNFENLATVDIVSVEEMEALGYNASFVGGLYLHDKNVLLPSDTIDFSIYHELFHCFARNKEHDSTGVLELPYDFSRALNEGITQILTEPYAKDKSKENAYYSERCLAAMIIQIIGEDKVLEAYTTGNFDIIKKEMDLYTEGYGYEDFNTITFFNMMMQVNKMNNNQEYFTMDENGQKDFTALKQQSAEYAYQFLEYVYAKKFHKDVKDDLLMQIYFAGICSTGALDVIYNNYYHIFDLDIFNYYKDGFQPSITVHASDLSLPENEWDFKKIATYNMEDIRYSYSGENVKDTLTDIVSNIYNVKTK